MNLCTQILGHYKTLFKYTNAIKEETVTNECLALFGQVVNSLK
uniref:Uncharacterized protein n=1 Tax=Anguilla anguilla TaxID=7936 RepID=A0A0E9WP17_ANGAN